MSRMSRKLIGDLGEVLYRLSCRADADYDTAMNAMNMQARVLDLHGQDFRLFLRAAGADDEEQAKGRMRL